MAGEVTTGQELGSYSGNAALAGGEASNAIGWKDIDTTPLQTYALKRYATNLVNYETQEKDRAKAEQMYLDPNINVPLDEHLAEQVRPKMEEMKNLMAKNPSAATDPKSWYKIQALDKELLQQNARLKSVQDLKNKYNGLAGAEPDEFKKKNYQDYVSQLEKYKLGEDVPPFNDHFVFDEKHLPELKTADVVTQRINGDKVETVRSTMYNGIDALQKARDQHITNGEVNNTGQDLASTLLTHGGLDDLNNRMAKAYDQQIKLNFGLLHDKYATEFGTYQKANPNATFSDFLKATNRQGEIKGIVDNLAWLKQPLTYVPDQGQNNPDLSHNYAYDDKGVRLSADNDTLRAIYSVLRNPAGAKEEILKTELSKTPSEIKLNEAKANAATANAKSNRIKANATAHKLYKQANAINPLPPSEVPLIGREAVINTIITKQGDKKTSEDQFIIPISKIPEPLRKKAGFAIMPTKRPVQPKLTGEPSQDKIISADYKTALKEYDEAKSSAENGSYQMRFFDAKGNDHTDKFIKIVQSGRGNINDALKEAPGRGYVVKFIDRNGNVVGTTESTDRQTLIENNKTNSDKEVSLGIDLPTDEE